ncbi:nuclear transport factor 2 family protein [Desertimonas flava]|uniref:nuclear transport factor 2 family protein n=1 Tax=Desertimonas flava TaxID=2064846 RepID=UPI0013C42ECA|nr:nuclear transport factor 2 family protein [Desertimonas flava]
MATPVPADDFVAISRLVHRYADAVVHRDADRWGSCWATDATWELGPGRQVEGRAAIVGLWTSAMAGMAAVVQMVHNGDVEVGDDDGTATGRWYIDERFRRATGANEILLAHYEDGYVRTADGWRFSRRRLQVHYIGPPDLSAEFSNTADGLAARGA